MEFEKYQTSKVCPTSPPVHFNVTDFHSKDKKNSQKLNFSQHQHFIIFG